jgi:hypothetical protein
MSYVRARIASSDLIVKWLDRELTPAFEIVFEFRKAASANN